MLVQPAHPCAMNGNTMTTFIELGIDTDIVAALKTKGITAAFPIQEQTIPLALTGQDVIGQAKNRHW